MACYDPRLDSLLRPALGLEEGQGFLFRTAGAVVSPTGTTLRSLTLAVYMFEVREILVLGHSSCRMAAFKASDFIAAFRGRGVAREAFGDQDLRTWAGAVASPRQGVLASASAIASAPFLPNDLVIAGAVLDDTTGEIEMVLRPGQVPPDMLPWAETKLAAAKGAARAAPDVVAAPGVVAAASNAAPQPPPPPAPAAALSPAFDAVTSVVDFLASQSHMYAPLAHLRHSLQQEKNPLKQLALVRKFVQSGSADTQELREAFKKLAEELEAEAPHYLSQVIHPLIHRNKP